MYVHAGRSVYQNNVGLGQMTSSFRGRYLHVAIRLVGLREKIPIKTIGKRMGFFTSTVNARSFLQKNVDS